MKLIHVAKGVSGYYVLKEVAPLQFEWFKQDQPTGVAASNIQEACRLAYKAFAADNFQPLPCGTKLTLPERDEHGSPALFYEMMQSVASPNGVYFDPAYGHNLIVHQIPSSTRALIPLFVK